MRDGEKYNNGKLPGHSRFDEESTDAFNDNIALGNMGRINLNIEQETSILKLLHLVSQSCRSIVDVEEKVDDNLDEDDEDFACDDVNIKSNIDDKGGAYDSSESVHSTTTDVPWSEGLRKHLLRTLIRDDRRICKMPFGDSHRSAFVPSPQQHRPNPEDNNSAAAEDDGEENGEGDMKR